MVRTRLVILALVCGIVSARTRHRNKALADAIEAERAGNFDRAWESIEVAAAGRRSGSASSIFICERATGR